MNRESEILIHDFSELTGSNVEVSSRVPSGEFYDYVDSDKMFDTEVEDLRKGLH